MSAIAFDPWAALKAHQEVVQAANPANPANPSAEGPAQLAGLAGLAEVPSPTVCRAALARHSSFCTAAIRHFQDPRTHTSNQELAVLAPWHAGVERLASSPCPAQIEAGRWSALRTTAAWLLIQHGPALHGAGWGTLELFGLHRQAPATFPPGWCLAWLLEAAGEVLDIRPNEIAMRRAPSGARLVYLRRGSIPGVVPIWCLYDSN